MAAITIELGGPPGDVRRYREDPARYRAGYEFADRYILTLTHVEIQRQLAQPCSDSFTEGFQDRLAAKACKHV